MKSRNLENRERTPKIELDQPTNPRENSWMTSPMLASIFAVLLIAGCNYNDLKNASSANPPGKATDGRGTPEASIDFATVRSQVLEPACIKCHGPTLARGGVRVDTYQDAINFIAAIRTEVEGGTMPPPPPKGTILSPEQQVMLIAWIDSGAPEFTVVSPPIQPPPVATEPPVPPSTPPSTPSEPPPDFATVRTMVFEPHCVKCHGATSTKGGVNLEVYTNAARHATEIGDSLDTDDMPRKAPALDPKLKAIVYAWIAAGAPETVTVVNPPPFIPPFFQPGVQP